MLNTATPRWTCSGVERRPAQSLRCGLLVRQSDSGTASYWVSAAATTASVPGAGVPDPTAGVAAVGLAAPTVAVAAAEAGVGAGGGAVMTGTGWVAAAGAPGAVAATPATEDTAVGVAIRGACALAVPG